MASTSPLPLKPRKSPVQARSAASVEAILDATLQVLLSVGKERLTTTRVARRAGVSVGTLYQYFPNKSSLLQAALRRNLESVRDTMCERMRTLAGAPLDEMVATVAVTFLEAKLREPRASVALYAVSSDVDGWTISREISDEIRAGFAALLKTAPEPVADAELTASGLLGAIGGVARRLVESANPEEVFPAFKRELEAMMRAYAAQAVTSSRSR